nr:reverse transcriptase domain-containing protein [Tanacetum cinerariifolium]
MADNRTMAQMLQAPIEGYEDAIVVPPMNANNFELKQTLINLVQSNQFTGRQDQHNHLRFFNKVTSTFRHPEVPNTTVKLFLFPFSLEGEARIWLDKEPPRSILTWEDLKIAAALEDKLDIRMNRFEKSLNEMKNSIVTPTAPLKAVTEVCVTCGSNHSYNQCPLSRGGNDFLVFHDNIQQFQTAAVGNLIQNRQNVSNQTRPPGFHQPTQQNNNQNRFQSKIPKAKPNLPYPSRIQKEKNREKDDILAAKFMEIFRDLHFELSFADALIHMPKFAPMFKKLLNNKDKLIELTKTPLNENYSAVVLKKRPEKLGDPADFVILDFVADPRVPIILGRPFLSTAHAIINVFEREIIIRQNQQSLTIQCSDIQSVKKIEQINKIKFINAGGIDSELEEIEDFLNDDPIQFGVEDSPFNMDKDILFLESLLRDDPIPPYLIIPNQTKLPIEETNHSLKMGYEHFNTNLPTKDVAESRTKNLIPIPNECIIVSDNGSQSTEPINDDSSNPVSDESTVKSDYFDEFYGPFIPIHILEEERTRREHADYIKQMEMLFTINPQIDVVSETNDVLPPRDDDSDDEVDVDGDLHVDNIIQNSEHEYSKSEDFDLDNPLLPLPPPEPPDKEFEFKIDFEKEISIERNLIVKFECIDARMKFDVENVVFKFIMFSLLSAESEDTIFDPCIFE